MYWQHLLRGSEDPLLVGVGGEVVGGSVVGGNVVEQVLVWRSGVFRAMRSRIGHHCHEWGFANLAHLGDELDGSVGDQVRKIILGVVAAMAPPEAVIVDAVVVVGAVLDQTIPPVPAWRHSVTIILVQIFAKVCCCVAALLEISRKCSLLMVLNPGGGATVVIVGEDMVIVDIETSQQG